jgi:hypothetical protein
LVPGFGGRGVEVRYAAATVTWPGASSICTQLTVTHGLGKTPAVVVATAVGSGSEGQVIAVHVSSYTATSFQVQAEYVKGFAPVLGTTRDVAWIAIG